MLRSLRDAVNPPKRLAQHVEPGDLGAWLRTTHLGRTFTYHDSIASTQDEAWRLARGDAPHGHVIWAGEQTAGRGRLDRRWHAPAMSGLWFSVILRPRRPAPDIVALPLAAGAAVGSALDGFAPGEVRLKWPNDVLLGGRKVAGILVEGHVHDGIMETSVVGVGINLERPRDGFAAEIEETAAALAEVATVPSSTTVLAAVLGALEARYEDLLAAGPAEARRCWLALADTIGREVVAQAGGVTITGEAVDLDEGGNLVVLSDGRRRVISYGEIQHLR